MANPRFVIVIIAYAAAPGRLRGEALDQAPAQLHLAEDALALHLLLQDLKRLVDIVVTDENLHAVFLFDRAIAGTDA
jgi:hypothetical protein